MEKNSRRKKKLRRRCRRKKGVFTNLQTWDEWSCGQDGPQERKAELRSQGQEAGRTQTGMGSGISKVHPVVLKGGTGCLGTRKTAPGAERAKEEG